MDTMHITAILPETRPDACRSLCAWPRLAHGRRHAAWGAARPGHGLPGR